MKAHYNDYITIGPAIGGIQNKKKTFFFDLTTFQRLGRKLGKFFVFWEQWKKKKAFEIF